MTQPGGSIRQRPSASSRRAPGSSASTHRASPRIDIPQDEQHLLRWLDAGFHGEMDYMRRHGVMRSRPRELAPGTIRVVSARMDYWPAEPPGTPRRCWAIRERGYVSRYALGRDYHKVLRAALARLAQELAAAHRPVRLSRLRRQRAGAGEGAGPQCRPRLDRQAHQPASRATPARGSSSGRSSPTCRCRRTQPASAHCGTLHAPASRPVRPRRSSAPYRLDARRCISYLTIEHHSAIPLELRPAIGNRIYGCDDCQLVCPWNKFARAASHPDFKVRHGLDAARLTDALRLDGGAVRGAHAGVGDLSHRLRALVAQHRGGARQCAARPRR